MISYVSPIYQHSKIEQAIYEAIGYEFDNADKLSKEVSLQLFPQTATWGLVFWEQRVGLATNLSEDIKKRRRKIIAKMQTRYPINPKNMAMILKNYTAADILITENVAPYTFKVISKVDDILDNRNLVYIVNKIKPSHLNWIQDFITILINKQSFSTKLTNRFFINFKVNMPSVLNGSWQLEGSNLLNGYELYFEPIKMGITNKFYLTNKNKINDFIRYICSILKKENIIGIITCKCSIKDEERIKDNLQIINTLTCKKTETLISRIRIEKNLWCLDGTFNLNCNKKLNAEVKEEEL